MDYKLQDNFTFDYTGLSTPFDSNSETNGQDTILNDYSLWFQLWSGSLPVSEQRFAKIPFVDGVASTPTKIDLRELAGSLVKTTFPLWAQSGPALDVYFSKEVYLRFGGITKDSQGVNTFGQTYESNRADIANAVFQRREINEFKNHHPDFIATGAVQWLTDRPQNYPVPLDSYEWTWIWIDNTDTFPITVNGFKLVYTFYYPDDITDSFETVFQPSGGAYIIPTGTANPDLSPYIGDCIKYEVQVFGKDSGEAWIAYSVILTRHVRPGYCFDEEIYFLEDKGSFGTLTFKAIDEVQLLQEGVTIDTPVDLTSSFADLYPEGGRSTIVERAIEKCFIISESLSRQDELMKFYEQALRSPEHYIRTTKKGVSDGVDTRRRVVIDRQNSRLFKRENKTSIILAYTFTEDLNTQ